MELSEVGEALKAQGDLSGALKSYRDSLGIREKLIKQDPDNAVWQRELAWIYWRTGSAWAELEPKSKNEARTMVEKARDILRQLKEPTDSTANREEWFDSLELEAANQQEWLDSIEADLRKLQEKKK